MVGSYNYILDRNSSTAFKRTVLPGTRILHPDFDYFAYRNDLMLFKIDPVPIKPAELNLDPAAPAPGRSFTVIGFGEVTPNSSEANPPEFPETLQKVRQFVVDGATCKLKWGADAGVIDNRTMICAEANSSTPSGICGGTSTGVSRLPCHVCLF
jgi:Trypsin